MDRNEAMSWANQAIWWQVYPLGFSGAPIRDAHPSPAPRLRRLLGWLDYAVEMGVSGLLLGPIFASQTHGYDTVDHFRIDPRLGGDEDFDALVAACQGRGLRILLDGVFSHVGVEHPALSRVLAEGPESHDARLFDIDWNAAGGPAPRVFEGHAALVRLNHGADQAVDYTVAAMEHWLARGIDGWRLDAAYSVGTDFWMRVLPRVRAHYPEAWILGEVIHGDYSQFVAASGVDSVTQYELWKAIWSSIKDRNMFELDWSLTRHNGFLAHFTPQTFIGNHDVTRIASALGPDGALAAAAILLTVGGIPSIYYGDEQGFVGIKEQRLGGDDDVRPAFPNAPWELADWGRDIYRAHQELVALRRRNPWLVTATTTALQIENSRYCYRAQAADGRAFMDVNVDLTVTPSVTIKNADGQVLWAQRRH